MEPPAGTVPTTADTAPIPIGPVVCITVVALLVTIGLAVPQTFFNVYMDVGLQQSTALIGMLIAATPARQWRRRAGVADDRGSMG